MVRAVELYQIRVVTSRVTPFGLGSHFKADVLRVQWTNGVPQTIYFPGTDQDVLEMQQLKGSCAFLYTWDGTHFRFITDIMWQSALGMPVGIMGNGNASYAPAGPSREYVRIPGGAPQGRCSCCAAGSSRPMRASTSPCRNSRSCARSRPYSRCATRGAVGCRGAVSASRPAKTRRW